MNILLLIVVFIGVAMVVYAIYGIFSPANSYRGTGSKRKILDPELDFKEQKIQRLEGEISSLLSELEKVKADYANTQKEFEIAKLKESRLQEEVTRRGDWVAKAEGALNKAKEENLDLNNKFLAKEKESQEEFAKTVNLNKELRELNERLVYLEKENKDKSDQIEAGKHRIEKYANEVKTYLETIAEFKKKEQISEWVPKQEFNKLNEEYIELENELIQLKNQIQPQPEETPKQQPKQEKKENHP